MIRCIFGVMTDRYAIHPLSLVGIVSGSVEKKKAGVTRLFTGDMRAGDSGNFISSERAFVT